MTSRYLAGENCQKQDCKNIILSTPYEEQLSLKFGTGSIVNDARPLQTSPLREKLILQRIFSEYLQSVVLAGGVQKHDLRHHFHGD